MKKLLVIAVLCFVFLGSPAVSLAQTLSISQLQTIVASLQAQLNALIAQLNQLQQQQNNPIVKPIDRIKPSITVISPNGGERLIIGSNVSLKWRLNNISSSGNVRLIVLPARCGNNDCDVTYEIARSLTANSSNQSYSWTVGKYLGGTIPLGEYKLRISYQSNGDASYWDVSDSSFGITNSSDTNSGPSLNSIIVSDFDESDCRPYVVSGRGLLGTAPYIDGQGATYSNSSLTDMEVLLIPVKQLSIRGTHTVYVMNRTTGQKSNTLTFQSDSCPPASSQDITVGIPNGGESWQIGTSHGIFWNGGYGSSVSGKLTSVTNGKEFWIFSTGIPNGSFIWNTKTVYATRSGGSGPVTLPADSYKLTILDDYGNEDTSDNYFTITNSETPSLRSTINVKVLKGGIYCIKAPCEFPLSGAEVSLYNSSNVLVGTKIVDGSGLASFSVNPGTYTARAKAPGYGDKSGTAGVVVGQTANIPLLLNLVPLPQAAANSDLAAVLQSLQGVLKGLSGALTP